MGQGDRDVAIRMARFDGFIRDVESLATQTAEYFGSDLVQALPLDGAAYPVRGNEPEVDVLGDASGEAECFGIAVPPPTTNCASCPR